MKGKKQTERYIKFFIYVVVVVLINIAGASLFFRFDLTQNHIYSLSPASKQAVATLSEPLTIDVFFTENLPAPYNDTRRYLRDLLEEYAIYAKKPFFNFRFYNVSPKEEGISGNAEKNRKMAESYGIYPVQIRTLEQDEMKFKNAYMGLVLIHGNLVDKIPALTSTNGLEYKLTTAIQKLNNKISKLVGLKGKIHVRMVMSSSLEKVAPAIGIKNLPQFPGEVRKIVEQLNEKNYDRLDFQYINPEQDRSFEDLQKKYHLMMLKWPAITEQNIPAGEGTIGLIVSYKDNSRVIPLMNVYHLPLFGTRYELTKKEDLESSIDGAIETVIGINENLGYLADHGTLDLSGPMSAQQNNPGDSISHFESLVSKNYTLKPIDLSKQPIPDNLNCLVIAHPTEKFSDYELYQIDQALMRGTDLLIFSDAFKEVQSQNPQQRYYMGPSYQPLDTGLDKLLKHYGVDIEKSFVMDKNCFKQKQSSPQGVGSERPIYFAPLIKNENINHNLAFMKNIKGLVSIYNSPVTTDADTLKKDGLQANALFSSSDKSWEMKGQIHMNPMFIRPPQSADQFKSHPLAQLVKGDFTSYFAGKPIPEKKKAQSDTGKADDKKPAEKSAAKTKEDSVLSKIENKNAFISHGRPAEIAVVGSEALLKNNMIDEQGDSPNAMFVLNLVDALNGREDIAAMRSKTQQYNPLNDVQADTKWYVKLINIAGLPLLIVFFGLIVWWRRRAKKRRIRMIFQG